MWLTPEAGRNEVQPSPANGLHKPSQVMVNKAQSVPREKIGDVVVEHFEPLRLSCGEPSLTPSPSP